MIIDFKRYDAVGVEKIVMDDLKLKLKTLSTDERGRKASGSR
jgi:hypothetical protein